MSAERPSGTARASAVIDLDALAANLARVRGLVAPAVVIAVVKAEAYGHGAADIARALRAEGVDLLAVALPEEALALRAAGDSGRLLAWLWAAGDPAVGECVASGVELGVSSRWALDDVVAGARAAGRTAVIHLKADTGLWRNGAAPRDWPHLVDLAAQAQRDGTVRVAGLWSHLADGEVAASASAQEQEAAFRQACDVAQAAGISAQLRHLGNSGSAWTQPQWDFEAVRSGIALYGLTPGTSLGTPAALGLVPVMTLRARLAHVKAIPAGARVSYGGTWAAPVDTTVGLVPLGYADGIPRTAGGVIEVAIAGRRVPIVGRVAMDQFVVDLGPHASDMPGDEVVLFGPGTGGELTADEWADRTGTIGYEIVTRISARVPREYVGGDR